MNQAVVEVTTETACRVSVEGFKHHVCLLFKEGEEGGFVVLGCFEEETDELTLPPGTWTFTDDLHWRAWTTFFQLLPCAASLHIDAYVSAVSA